MKRLALAAMTAAALVACTDRPTLVEPPNARRTPAADPQVSAAGLLPDLGTLAPSDLCRVAAQGRQILRFTNTITNTGNGRLHVTPQDDGTTQYAIQHIFDADGNVVDQRVVSQYEYHAGHNHWHIANVALYEVRSGSPTGSRFSWSQKTTFCLIDLVPVAPNPAPRTYTQCNAQAQGISVGWGDEYGYWLDGQSVDITGAPNGRYYLVSTANPAGVTNSANGFIEADYSNNKAWVSFRVKRGRAQLPQCQ